MSKSDPPPPHASAPRRVWHFFGHEVSGGLLLEVIKWILGALATAAVAWIGKLAAGSAMNDYAIAAAAVVIIMAWGYVWVRHVRGIWKQKTDAALARLQGELDEKLRRADERRAAQDKALWTPENAVAVFVVPQAWSVLSLGNGSATFKTAWLAVNRAPFPVQLLRVDVDWYATPDGCGSVTGKCKAVFSGAELAPCSVYYSNNMTAIDCPCEYNGTPGNKHPLFTTMIFSPGVAVVHSDQWPEAEHTTIIEKRTATVRVECARCPNHR